MSTALAFRFGGLPALLPLPRRLTQPPPGPHCCRAILQVAKSLGRNILVGNFDLLKVSFPVVLFEPRSFLQKLTDPWCFPRFLSAAAAAGDDPVDRLRHVVTYVLAGYHRVFRKWAKPFNPLQGETWQALLPDGTRIYLEQVSHHPPVSAWEMHGPHGAYIFHGASQPSVSYKANAIHTSAGGQRRLLFADGGAVEISSPRYVVRGLLAGGAPRADLGDGGAEFVDRAHGLTAVLRFGKVEGAPAGSLLARSDAVSGTIYRTGAQHDGGAAASRGAAAEPGVRRAKSAGSVLTRLAASLNGGGAARMSAALGDEQAREAVASCSGNWLSHLDWDGGQRAWTLLEEEVQEWVAEEAPLSTDSRFRPDLELLAKGDLAGAQAAKERLENQQRRDAKFGKGSAAAPAAPQR